MCKYVSIAGVYLVVAFGTFAWHWDSWEGRETDREMGSIFGGAFWPIYWAGYASRAIVHGLRQPAPTFKCIAKDGTEYSPDHNQNNEYWCRS